jgi:cob(I)alamin adenosyltransferase
MQRRLPIGIVHVYTGEGKGKTSAALGLAWRALAAGLRVAIIQFIKGGQPSSELALLGRLGYRLWVRRFAQLTTPFSLGQGPPGPEDQAAVAAAWQAARTVLASGAWDVVVLDEINNALQAGMLSAEEVLATLRARPAHVEVVCTGRGAPDALAEAADLVTEFRQLKHPYAQGVGARPGIEY